MSQPTPIPVLLDTLETLFDLILSPSGVVYSDAEFQVAGLDAELIWRLHQVTTKLTAMATAVGWKQE